MKFSHWLTLSALVTITLLFWSLKEIIIQIFAGIILAMALCTLVGKIQSTIRISRSLALLFTIIGFLIVSSISLILIIPQFTNEFQQILIQLPSAAKTLLEIIINSINYFSRLLYGENAKDLLKEDILLEALNQLPDGVTLANGITDSIKKLLDLAGNLGIGLVRIIFVLSISLMIAVQPIAYREVIIQLIPSFYRRRARSILLKCGNSLSDWMIGVIISSSFVAILAGLTLYLLGVKLVIANALLAGILNIIPNVGPTISTIFPFSVALIDSPWKSVAVIGAYIIIQNLESYIITPSVMQHQVKLLPGFTLTAQFIFTVIFGPIGLLLSLPLAVVLQVLIREVLIKDILNQDNFAEKNLLRSIK